jgi:hypothetical protein
VRKAQRKDTRAGLSPRAYQARLDRCQLWDLVCRRTPQTEIAHVMNKDPAWVSRTIQEIQSDFSTARATPNESGIIQDNIVRWETLYAEARREADSSNGFKRVSALRLCAELLRHKAEYEVTVGWVGNRRYGDEARRGPTMEELRGEISLEDLEDLFVTVADSIKERQMKAADVKEVPALPPAIDAAS